jgi:putative component of membrane protein insertase Oxa1/YidC/SpoIIIJ protein YidD
MSSTIIKVGRLLPQKRLQAKAGSLAKAGSDGCSTIRGLTMAVYLGAESSTQHIGRIMAALSWPTFLRWYKYLQASGKPFSCRPQNFCHLGALTSVDPFKEWSGGCLAFVRINRRH